MKYLIALLTIAALTSCNTPAAKNVETFAASPTGQIIIAKAVDVITTVAISASNQYVSNGKVTGRDTLASILSAQGALYGAATVTRSSAGTELAKDPASVSALVTAGAALPAVSNKVAPVVSTQVQAMIAQGVTPAVAIETASAALEKAAASK